MSHLFDDICGNYLFPKGLNKEDNANADQFTKNTGDDSIIMIGVIMLPTALFQYTIFCIKQRAFYSILLVSNVMGTEFYLQKKHTALLFSHFKQ